MYKQFSCILAFLMGQTVGFFFLIFYQSEKVMLLLQFYLCNSFFFFFCVISIEPLFTVFSILIY